jgi:hemerythrin superfamily protein
MGPTTTASGLNDALRFDHQRLEINLRHVHDCLNREGASTTCTMWLRFYHELGAHIEAEDVLLPAFAQVDPEGAGALEREHERIRSLATTLTEDFVRGAVGARSLERFGELFAAHGRREESSLYPWAEYGVGEVESRAVIERIRDAGVDRPHQEYLP